MTTEQYLKDTSRIAKPDFVVVDLLPAAGGKCRYASLCVDASSAAYLRIRAFLRRWDGTWADCSAGYRIKKAHMIDMFPQTYHVESVFQLVR